MFSFDHFVDIRCNIRFQYFSFEISHDKAKYLDNVKKSLFTGLSTTALKIRKLVTFFIP